MFTIEYFRNGDVIDGRYPSSGTTLKVRDRDQLDAEIERVTALEYSRAKGRLRYAIATDDHTGHRERFAPSAMSADKAAAIANDPIDCSIL
jgi:hypothetical protein